MIVRKQSLLFPGLNLGWVGGGSTPSVKNGYYEFPKVFSYLIQGKIPVLDHLPIMDHSIQSCLVLLVVTKMGSTRFCFLGHALTNYT